MKTLISSISARLEKSLDALILKKRANIQNLGKRTQFLYIFLLFSRDKYIRPYEKSTLIQELEMNVIHDLTFDVEFSELEQLGKQKISRELLKNPSRTLVFFFISCFIS